MEQSPVKPPRARVEDAIIETPPFETMPEKLERKRVPMIIRSAESKASVPGMFFW